MQTLILEPSHSYVSKTNTPDGNRYAQIAFLDWIVNGRRKQDGGFAYLTRNPVTILDLVGNILMLNEMDHKNTDVAAYLNPVDVYHVAGSVGSKGNADLLKGGRFKPRKLAQLPAANPTQIVQELSEPPRDTLIGPGVVELMRSSVGVDQTVRVLGSLADTAANSEKVLYVVLNPKAFPDHVAEMLVTAPQLEPVQG